ncbi:transposase [Streptomyces chartreusis]|uniref:transposase n=1 Tax=Streptomyces chartreusis TaxID=1969 RepID=UPI0037F5E0AE
MAGSGPIPRITSCTKVPSGRRGRGITFLPRERHEALEAVRQAQVTDERKDRYAIRAGVEGTTSQAVRVTCLRRTRHCNLPVTASVTLSPPLRSTSSASTDG